MIGKFLISLEFLLKIGRDSIKEWVGNLKFLRNRTEIT